MQEFTLLTMHFLIIIINLFLDSNDFTDNNYVVVNKETSVCIDKVATTLTVATISVTNCNNY